METNEMAMRQDEELARSEPPRSKFRAIFEDAAKDVPPEAWDEVPSDASSNIDHYLSSRKVSLSCFDPKENSYA
jgi:hypothetical protein